MISKKKFFSSKIHHFLQLFNIKSKIIQQFFVSILKLKDLSEIYIGGQTKILRGQLPPPAPSWLRACSTPHPVYCEKYLYTLEVFTQVTIQMLKIGYFFKF